MDLIISNAIKNQDYLIGKISGKGGKEEVLPIISLQDTPSPSLSSGYRASPVTKTIIVFISF